MTCAGCILKYCTDLQVLCAAITDIKYVNVSAIALHSVALG